MENVRPNAEQLIRESSTYLGNGEISYWSLQHVRKKNPWMNQNVVSGALARMEGRGELVRVTEGRFQRASMAKRWIVKPWRKRTNERVIGDADWVTFGMAR